MKLSSTDPEFPYGFLEGISELPWDHGKKQLRTTSAVVWVPIEREREEYFAYSAAGRGSAQQKRSTKVLLPVWFGLKFRWKGVVTYWSGRVLSSWCSPRRVWGWAGLNKEGSETCVPSWSLSKVLPWKNSVKFVWEVDVQHVVCGMVAFLLGLHDTVSGFYRHKKLFCREVSFAGLALLGLFTVTLYLCWCWVSGELLP